MQSGKVLKHVEIFEPPVGDVPPGALAVLDSMLLPGVPNCDPWNGYGFPNGLSDISMAILSNAQPFGGWPASPSGPLVAMGQGCWDGGNIPNSIVVGAQDPYESVDILIPIEDRTAIGFDVIDPSVEPGSGQAHIAVLGRSDLWWEIHIVPAQPAKLFFGISCPEVIERVNIGSEDFGLADGGERIGNFGRSIPGHERVDNIQLWADKPACPWDCEDPPDGTVDVGDFLALLAQWGTPGACDCEDPPDGAVDVGDFLALLAAWGPCP